MSNLSSKDKARLALSAKRVERWNRERHMPVNNDKARCTSIVFANGQDKPGEVIKPDAMENVHRLSDGCKIRTMASKLSRHSNAIAARVHTIAHMRADGSYETQVILDHPDNDIAPRDPAWKAGQAKLVTPRKDSPFKRAGKSASKVTIVRV
jgi:hypothetical protein